VAEPSAGTATILFTDLVGSTELRARLGDVVADQLQRAHDDLLTGAIGEHAGAVVKSLGDGVLASFGGAADAVAAGVAIQQAVDRANRRVDDARRLEVRIGLSAGDVSWSGGDCHGTPVVVAARLCDRAEGGQVLCDDLVRGLARGRSDATFRLVGEIELKGLSDPVVGFDIPWERTAVGRAPLPGPLLSVAGELPFAGRDDERAALQLHWKSAQADGRTVALVSGEPGVGKTRLSSEVARAAHEDGAWVLVGRCDENVAAPFAPWIEMLRFAVTHAPAELLAAHVDRHGGELTRIVPDLARRVADVPAPRSIDPESERLALFDATTDLVGALALDAPALVLLDDAHWADGTSLDLLRHVVRHLPPHAPVLIVATYRDTDVDRAHPLADVIGHLRREPRVERIALRGIDEHGVRQLLTRTAGHELPEDGFELARTLARDTDGNPFFIGEILRHLIETGVLVQRDGRWEGTTSVDEAGIPEGIKDVVGRRLSRLSDSANETLRTAAVIGREFTLDVLAEVSELPEDTVLDHLEEAIGALRLVEEVSGSPGSMTFAHALVRSTLLDELSTTRRVRLHRRVGEALERRPHASAGELAHHFAEAATAGVADKAVMHARRAAAEALDRLAYDEAIHYLSMALEACEALDDEGRTKYAVLAARGFARLLSGDQDGGRADAVAAADGARAIGDAALLAEAGMAYQGWVGQWATPADPVAVELMEEGLAGLAEEAPVTRARATAMLALAKLLLPGDDSLRLAQEAEQLARAAHDDEALAYSLAAWAWALRGRGQPDELLRVASLGVEHATAESRPDWELTPRYHLGAARIALGDLTGAGAEYASTAAIPNNLHDWSARSFAATRAIADGRFDEADGLIEAASAVGSALGDTSEACRCISHIWLAISRGNVDDADRWATRLGETSWGLVSPWPVVVLAEHGDLVGAADALDRFEREAYPLVPLVIADQVTHTRSRIATLVGGAERASRIRPDVERYAGQIVGSDVFIAGAGDREIGNVALVEGKVDEAVPLLEAGLEQVERLGLRALIVEHRVDLARALLARGAPGDRDRAQAILSDALETARGLGLARCERDANALLA